MATDKAGYVEYSSNNSGGGWWLKDEHWIALEKAGWEVMWGKHDQRFRSHSEMTDKDRWLGALATSARRYGLNMRQAADEWERVTGLSATDAGCPCCGQPHNFTEYGPDEEYIASGPEVHYEASW